MTHYLYWWAVDSPSEPWTGPFKTHRQATLAGRRDGNHDKILFIRSGLVLGPGTWMEAGVERIPPGAG